MNKGISRIYSSRNFFLKNLTLIVAFVIPVIILICIFIGNDIYPFGDRAYLRSDMYHQYSPFLREFQRILKNGDSLLYTWNIGLGSDFPSTYAYYLASPVNWLVALLPSDNIPEIMGAFIIFKAGLMSGTFTYYIQKHFGRKTFIASCFGIFYGMSSYMAAYSWNLMWLDCLVLLPLIVLGLERLVKENRVGLYTVSLGLCIFSNYYISIMIAIFLVLYFVYLLIAEFRCPKFSGYAKASGRFALYSVISGLMAAAAIIPAFIMLSSTASGSFNFPTQLKAYYNILEMAAHSLMLAEPTVLSGYVPNVYSTAGLFMFIPLYFINRNIRLREKIGKAVLLAIFIFSFAFNIPTYIWHGFHYPNSLSSRQSFIYIFLTLVMACELVMKLKSIKIREIIIFFVCGVAAVFGLQYLYSDPEDLTVYAAIASAGFIALYTIWMVIRKTGRGNITVMLALLMVVVTAEASINTAVTGYSTTSRTNLVSDNEDITYLLDSIDDDGFYRVEKTTRRTKNDGAWSDYMSASEFSSTTPAALSDFYKAMGMQGQTNSYSYYGHTPLMGAILGVKYVLSDEDDADSDVLMEKIGTSSGEYLYQNKYSLSLGFMINADAEEETDLEAGNPFAVQNSFTAAATGCEDLFRENSTASGGTVNISVENTGRGFVYISEKLSDAIVAIIRDGEEIFNQTFTGLENPQIIDIGDVEAGDIIIVTSDDEDVSNITVYSAVMDYDDLDDVMELLGENQYDIEEFSDTYVSGTIHADEEGLMFTSIPCSTGWEVYVDGEKVETSSFCGAFLTITLTEGDHTVEFKYHSPGFGAAILISIIAVWIFINTMMLRRRKCLNNKRQ